jgi:hypothetical protein
MLQQNSRRYMTFEAHTIISCKYYYILLLWRRNVEGSIQETKERPSPHPHTKYLALMLLQTRLLSRLSLPLSFKVAAA